jgi:hypothetical protein
MSRKRTTDQETPETTTTIANTPPAEATAEGPSFAERVGQRKPAVMPDPFGIAVDTVAGVRLFESKRDRQMAIKFGEGRPEDKPSQAVINTLKEAGYRWDASDRVWIHPVRQETAMSTRIEAERLYQQIRQDIRQEKGIEPAQDIPF